MYSITIQGETLETFAERIAAVNAQFATLATSRNALSAADKKAIADAKANKADDEAREALQAKRNAGRAGKAEEPLDGTPSPAPAAEEKAPAAEPAEVSASDEAPKIEYAQVSTAVLSLVKAKGRDAAVAVLSQFGVGNAKELAEAQWPEALEALNAELTA